MEKIYLTVTFAEKDEAKALGAKWDADAKKWYILPSSDASKFTKWLPAGNDNAS